MLFLPKLGYFMGLSLFYSSAAKLKNTMAQLLIPVSGRVQLKGRGLLDPTWLHDAQADSAGYR